MLPPEIWSGCGLVTILESVKIQVLRFINQSLGSEETRALVRAMEAGVGSVWFKEESILDIRALTEYDGQGKCFMVSCINERGINGVRYREQLRTWATSRNWKVVDNENVMFMKRWV